MKKIILIFLTMICIFFISFNGVYSSEYNDTNKQNLNSNYQENSKNNNTHVNNNNLTKNTNSSNSNKILASGDNEKPTSLSQDEILDASKFMNEYISNHGKLPNYVTISDYKFSIPEFTYLLAKTIQYKSSNNKAQVKIKYNIKNPTKPTGKTIKGKISYKNYKDYTDRVVKHILRYNKVPNYVSTTLGEMQYQTIVYSFMKILKENIPKTLSVSVTKGNKINKHIPKYSRSFSKKTKPLNEAYDNEPLNSYLIATKNCQVNDAKIKALAKQITKNSKTNYEKANSLFLWVRDKIEYSFYYNTKYGAKNTISKKSGNCVDKSHLLIALCRSVNLPARYVHGNCKFISGNVYGHVWVQILVGNTWTAADTTHSQLNKLGVINNWDSGSYTLKGKYNEITF